mgnify:CR=1 FL=1
MRLDCTRQLADSLTNHRTMSVDDKILVRAAVSVLDELLHSLGRIATALEITRPEDTDPGRRPC